jgi:hypothetical protein
MFRFPRCCSPPALKVFVIARQNDAWIDVRRRADRDLLPSSR